MNRKYSNFVGYISDLNATPYNSFFNKELIGTRDQNRVSGFGDQSYSGNIFWGIFEIFGFDNSYYLYIYLTILLVFQLSFGYFQDVISINLKSQILTRYPRLLAYLLPVFTYHF